MEQAQVMLAGFVGKRQRGTGLTCCPKCLLKDLNRAWLQA